MVRASLDIGWRNPPVRWLMLAGLCAGGVSIFAFYALQPYLLELYGDRGAFGIAGLAAAIVAGSQMVAGLIVPAPPAVPSSDRCGHRDLSRRASPPWRSSE